MPPVDYNFPKSTLERVFDYLALMVLVFLFIFTYQNFVDMPDTVPIHFNIKGEVDNWGSRWFVWFLPLTAVFTFVLLLLPEKFPQSMNYPVKITEDNAQRQYLLARVFLKTLKLGMVLMMFGIQYALIHVALQKDTVVSMSLLIPILLILIFGPIGLYMMLAIRAK